MQLDEIDLIVLDILKKDARTSFREIARKLKVSPDTIINKILKIKTIRNYSWL